MRASHRDLAVAVGLVALALTAGAPAAGQELGVEGGRDVRWFSEIRYRGYRTAAATLFVPGLLLERSRAGLGLEVRLSRHWGRDIPVRRDQLTAEEWAAFEARGLAPSIDVSHWALAVTPLWRQRFGTRFDWEGGLGLSWLDRPLLTGGTRWNFQFIGGAGVRLEGGGWRPVRAGLRVEHFSNGGKIGLTNARVIGLEALCLAVAWRLD